MAEDKSKQVFGYIKIVALIGGAFLAYKAVKNLAETFGLVKSEAEEKIDKGTEQAGGSTIEAQSSNPYLSFSPQYIFALKEAWTKKYPKKVWEGTKQLKFDATAYKKFADTLYNAKGIFKDDENSVLDIFRNLQTQFQVSQLAVFFSFFYKKDMLAYMKTFMDDDNLKEVLEIIKNYPQYYK
jgi:hypothetical protein